MSEIRNVGTSGKARNRRTFKVAPMTRAVRSALAVSALTLAIGFGGGAAAATPQSAVSAHALRIERSALDFAPVQDLTVVPLLVPGGAGAPTPTLIGGYYPGDANIVNNAPIIESQVGNAFGIYAYSGTGNVSIINGALGAISAHSDYGNAIGIYGYALAGDVAITNAASIVADAPNGLADAIFASGHDVTVINTGSLTATGYSWAAGIEAQAGNSVSVTNTGSITATATGGLAYGIYATGDASASVVNAGNITARGYYATGIHAESGGDVTITNYASGSIDAGTITGSALAWGIYAASNGGGAVVQVDNSAYIHAAAVYGATGISAVASGLGGSAVVNNDGDIVVQQNRTITSYGGYGILAAGDVHAEINNSGDITVTSRGPAFGLAALSTTGDAAVSNSGNVIVSSNINSTSVAPTGILAAGGYGSATVDNSGFVRATGVRVASGVDISGYGNLTVDNSGYIGAIANAGSGLSGRANGIKAVSGGGDIAISNSGEVYARGRTLALGVYALANGGNINVYNDAYGAIDFFSAAGRGWGVWTYAADGSIAVDNQGYIGGLALAQAYGVLAQAPQGNIDVSNGGTINATSASSTARGVLAIASSGTASIDNTGDIYATSGGFGFPGTAAYGVIASGAHADVSSSGNIVARGNTAAFGEVAQSMYGTTVYNAGGRIAAYANGTAVGISATASAGDVMVDSASAITAISQQGNATGIVANGYYGASIDNTGGITAVGRTSASGIRALSSAGDVTISNSGPVFAYTVNGNAIGLYGYSLYGNTSISNSGDLTAISVNGLADAIFASGADVSIVNSGMLYANGNTWAAGIEAQGTGTTSVQNDGDITAYARAGGAHAFGIYTTGDAGVTIANTGAINAQGYYATGIYASSVGGSISIGNTGNITAGYVYAGNYYSALATGIDAMSGGVGAQVDVVNSGDISALGYYGGTGISVVSSGLGGTASVDNSGNITVAQGNKYGYGANGIFVSADGDALITNSGAITVNSGGAAAGAVALSFAGDASVVNSGDISVDSTAFFGYNAYGVIAFSGNGGAMASNSGQIDVTTKYIGVGMDVGGLTGATADNSGGIAIDAWRAYGIRAQSGNGDVAVTNSGTIYATYSGSYGGTAFGILGIGTNGNVAIDNSGSIGTHVAGQSVGVFGISSYGDVSVTNSGSIDAYSGSNAAVGVFARADNGTASVGNSGSVSAYSYSGVAYGVIARGMDARVDNSGTVSADGYYAAIGVAASAMNSATITSSAGSVDAFALGQAIGELASAFYGDATITNASSVSAIGIYGGATGIDAGSVLGNASVANSGSISALSQMGPVTGVKAYTIVGDASIDNAGDVTAATFSSMYGTANAIGLYAYSAYGMASVHNTGAITAYSGTGIADAIFASGYVVDVDNSGALTAGGYAWGAGIEAQGTAYARVTNSGDITAYTMPFQQVVDYYGNSLGYANGGHAFGIYATGGSYGVRVTNSGAISVDGGYADGIYVQSGGNAVVVNSGDITAGSGLTSYYNSYNGYTYYSGTQLANGINASSNGDGAVVMVDNSGAITASGIFGANGISAVASGLGGVVAVYNDGNLTVSQANKYGYGAYGVFASADGDAFIDNGGTVTVNSDGAATGLAALSFAGDATVVNHGDLDVTNTAALMYGATGITAFSANGNAAVGNYGTVNVTSKYQATGIDARALGDVTVVNGGSLYANGDKYAFGVYASAGTGNAVVSNQAGADIGFYSYIGRGFGVLAVSSLGDVMVDNAGSIAGYAFGQSAGVFAVALQGDATVSNSGSIDVSSGGNVAVGVFARADYGTATAVNSGSIHATDFPGGYYTGYSAYGMFVRGDIAQAGNSGSISVDGYYAATGIEATSMNGTLVSNTGGSIVATATGMATGIDASSVYGNVQVGNASTITASGMYLGATGIEAMSYGGNASVTNTAAITVSSAYAGSIGILAGAYGNVSVTNAGAITATAGGAYALAQGIYAYSNSGDVTVGNTSAGHIEASGGSAAVGIHTASYDGTVVINNAGVVHASGGVYNAGVLMENVYGTSTLNNLAGGVISADGPDGYAFAVYGSNAVEIINNSGRILGNVVLLGGDDVFNNKAGGVWDVGATTYSDFGDGDDTLNNAAGGQVLLNGGHIAFGAGSDTVNNAGLIKMTNSSISMGPMVPLFAPLAGETNVFNNTGTLQVIGSNSIDTYGGTFNNTGLVNFQNGVTTDSLTLDGTLTGVGTMNIDVDLNTNTADQLMVYGDVAASAKQTVNVQFTGLPTATTTDIAFANVTGTSAAGNFVGGQFIGYNANANFLTLGLGVKSAINTANTSDDVFSISMVVNGLSDSGSLGASTASGMAGFMNAQVGTFRQRLGVNPYGDAGKVMSAFVRVYADQGDVSQKHASNFGNGGYFDFDTASWGREVGVNANLFGNFHAGLVLGSTDGRQRLTGGGVGESRMHAMTVGGYLTWYVPNGWYVDFSARQMAPDIHLSTSAGTMSSRTHVNAMSLEAGYEWNMGGFNLVPQAQYTRTKVEDATYIGNLDTMVAHGGTFERGRLGLELNKTFLSGDVRWMPYATLSAVHDFSGTSTYTVANVFNGSTSVKGTSAMAELGVGMQKGSFGLTFSASWNDGGPYKSVVGAQANLRYSW
ncbi:MAG: hypothetical protein J0I72_07970 [Stenotrophomonas sp.]|nr:hypothetical protein [Xanthomonadales bacterium]MBN8769262.1 hypothetical protein [Stenotrophomonas sp.]